jgi:hypothetical protein
MDKKIRYDKEKKVLIVEINNNNAELTEQVPTEDPKKTETRVTGMSSNTIYQELNEHGIRAVLKELNSQLSSFKLSLKRAKETMNFEKKRIEIAEKDLREITMKIPSDVLKTLEAQ